MPGKSFGSSFGRFKNTAPTVSISSEMSAKTCAVMLNENRNAHNDGSHIKSTLPAALPRIICVYRRSLFKKHAASVTPHS